MLHSFQQQHYFLLQVHDRGSVCMLHCPGAVRLPHRPGADRLLLCLLKVHHKRHHNHGAVRLGTQFPMQWALRHWVSFIFRQCAASICDSVCPGVRMSRCPDVQMSRCNNNFSPVRLYSLNLPPDARVAPGSCTVQYKQLIISVSVSVQRLE